MPTDPTEHIRRHLIETGQPMAALAELVGTQAPTWTTEELTRDFEVLGFMAPFVTVRRRVDGVLGSLEFTHQPRRYFNFQED